jgi:sarcosine dehydrogenase
VNRLPALETTGIKSEICGPLSFTVDDKPICGYAPGFKGYFFACGFDLGMMLGGAAGDQLAQWIVKGRPVTHLYAWDCRRFNPRVTHPGNQQWLRERTHERFATMYKAVYSKDEPLGGRMQITTPFHSEHAKNGVFYQERHGWERAGWFHPDKKSQLPGPYQWLGYWIYLIC